MFRCGSRRSKVWRAAMNVFRPGVLSGLFAAWSLAAGPSASADSVADFYKDKTVKIMVGYEAGNAYDTYARLLARFLSATIPGNPTLFVQNMPGAASMNAANYV